jgi:hypothetical protein
MLVDRKAAPGEGRGRNEAAPPDPQGKMRRFINLIKRKPTPDTQDPGEGTSRQRDRGHTRSPICKKNKKNKKK